MSIEHEGQITVSHVETVAGFAAAKHDLDQSVPSMFRGMIKDEMISRIVYDVQLAGARARAAHPDPHTLKIAQQPHVPMKGDHIVGPGWLRT